MLDALQIVFAGSIKSWVSLSHPGFTRRHPLERLTMTMRFFDEIWPLLNEGTVCDVRIGLNWTAVVVEIRDQEALRVGLHP